MKYVLGFLSLIVAILWYIKPEIFTGNTNLIYGSIYMLIANLYFRENNGKIC